MSLVWQMLISTVSQRFCYYSTQQYIKSTESTSEWRTEETICFFVFVRLMSCEWVSPCDMEGLSAAMFVARHTGSSGCFTLSALVLTDITCLHTYTHAHKQTQLREPFQPFKNSHNYMYMGFCDMSKCTGEFCYLVVALMGHWLKYYGLHSWDIGKFYLRYVKGTNDMGPACKNTQKTIISLCTFMAGKKVVCGNI